MEYHEYRYYDPIAHRLCISRQVTFFENILYFVSSSQVLLKIFLSYLILDLRLWPLFWDFLLLSLLPLLPPCLLSLPHLFGLSLSMSIVVVLLKLEMFLYRWLTMLVNLRGKTRPLLLLFCLLWILHDVTLHITNILLIELVFFWLTSILHSSLPSLQPFTPIRSLRVIAKKFSLQVVASYGRGVSNS